jgi:hypothetical protein
VGPQDCQVRRLSDSHLGCHVTFIAQVQQLAAAEGSSKLALVKHTYSLIKPVELAAEWAAFIPLKAMSNSYQAEVQPVIWHLIYVRNQVACNCYLHHMDGLTMLALLAGINSLHPAAAQKPFVEQSALGMQW